MQVMVDTQSHWPKGRNLLIAAACLVIVVAGLKAAASIFIPFMLAFFLAVLSFPLLFALRRRRVPAILAIAITMLTVVASLLGLGLFITASVNGVTQEMPRYQNRLRELVLPQVEKLDTAGFEASEWIDSHLLDVGAVLNLLTNTALGVATALTASLMVLLILVFILAESIGFRVKLAQALGSDNDVLRRFGKITGEVQNYLVVKTGISLVTGVAICLWVAVLGLDFPLFWGFIAFVLNFIPTIGSVVAGVPAVAWALVQLGPSRALLVALGFVVVNIIFGNLVEPALMGRRLRLSPLIVLMSLLFWGWVWGPVGAILSVPLTMVMKILLENTEKLRWVAQLMERNPRRNP